jgi:WD40 repeat protein
MEMNLVKKLKTSYQLVMSNNKKLLCHTMGRRTVIFNTETWEKVAELLEPKNPSYVYFSEDDELLYIKSTVGTVCVYDTERFQLITTIKSKRSFQIVEGNFAILDDPLTILDLLKINNKKQVCTLNIETGKYQVITEVKGTHIKLHQFVADDSSYLYTLSDLEGEEGWLVQKLVKLKDPLTKPTYSIVDSLKFSNWEKVFYEPVHRVYIFLHREYKLTFMDADLETILREDSLLDKGINKLDEYFVHIHASYNGKYIVLTTIKRVIILNFDDLIPVFIKNLEYACFAEFSKNDTYLLVGSWNNGYVLENCLP